MVGQVTTPNPPHKDPALIFLALLLVVALVAIVVFTKDDGRTVNTDPDPVETTTTETPTTTTEATTTTAPPETTTTTEAPPPPTTAPRATTTTRASRGAVRTDVWSALAACESGGDPTKVSASGKYRGAFQFSVATWESVGETGDPAAHSYAHQLEAAKRLQARDGWGQWPDCSRRLGLR